MISDIRKVNNLETLLGYFSTNLAWNIDLDDLDDIKDAFFNFSPEDLDLTEEHSAKIISIKQLRPLSNTQPFGIFSVEFESKVLQVTALRKILSKLVPKSRNANHAMWEKQDLLFLCFWGNSDNRTVGIAHFSDNNKNLPTLKLIHCATKHAVLEEINKFESQLSKLAWVEDTRDANAWREKWSNAFTIEYGRTVQDAKTLAVNLAELAKRTRGYILDIFAIETKKGSVHLLYEKFKNNLVHDLSIEQFADMYAQTVAYGLFSAKLMDTDGSFELSEVVDKIPNTNPFLKDLIKGCLAYKKGHSLSFDELELSDIIKLLDNTDTDQILKDFNRQTGEGKEDPVIYFYEGFLAEYESEQKKRRGVYYTPLPVVDFIVRAVDDLLKLEFGFVDGLADCTTKKLTIQVDKKTSNGTKNVIVDVPAIQILDPATGTGTFLRQAIIQIWGNFKDKNKGLSEEKTNELWNDYVPKHLLPRLNGFELMMAPYAVAHMKLALVLKETGYNFKGKERINVLLTNSLEEAGSDNEQLTLFENDPLAMEAICANKIKKNAPINVIIGNPPYLAASSNNGEFINNIMRGISYEKKIHSYFHIDGAKLDDAQKRWINDDYVKFIRFSQYILEKNNQDGIIGFITNHSFLDNPTFRGMRESLVKFFDSIYIVNLHGISTENCPNGNKDENVFDIKKGVAISIFVKNNAILSKKIKYVDLWGIRSFKYAWLNENYIDKIQWLDLAPAYTDYLLIPQDIDLKKEYNKLNSIRDVFDESNVGIVTSRDNLTIHFDKKSVHNIVEIFRCENINEISKLCEVRQDTMDWTLKTAKKDIMLNYNTENYKKILYRPFDLRETYYTGKTKGFYSRPAFKLMKYMINGNNIALISARSNKSRIPDQFFCTNRIMETKCGESTTQSSLFPLFKYYEFDGEMKREPNISKEFIERIEKKLRIKFSDTETRESSSATFYDMFDYIYGICFCPTYRSRYLEFLRLDFPKIPVTSNQKLFWKLVELGNILRNLHINGIDVALTSTFVSSGNNIVETVKYDSDKERLYINKESYFTGIIESVYKFTVGGYQICNKYLKDRKGRVLSQDEIDHLINTFDVIVATIATMGEIDVVIEQYGGFPIK